MRRPVSRMWLTSLEGQPEADLRRPRLGRHMLQVLRRIAFDSPDSPVRTIEYIEHFRDPVDGGAAVQRNPLLQPQVRPVLRGREESIARDDRAIRTQARGGDHAGL